VFILAVYVGFIESFRARNHMSKNPVYIFALFSMALLAFVVVLILTEKMLML